MLCASSGVVPVLLGVLCFFDHPLRDCGTVAWSTMLLVDGSENCIPLFRDDRFVGLSSGRSATLVESGDRLLCGPALGLFRPANAGCFFGNSVLIPFAVQ